MRRFVGKKGNKYGNKKTEYNGINFDSERECKRYKMLELLVKAGIISDLQVHRKFELIPAVKGIRYKQLKTKVKEEEYTEQQAITYTCDFSYIKDEREVIEDVKISPKMLPKEYLLKEKMMFWKYGIRIKRVYKPEEAI